MASYLTFSQERQSTVKKIVLQITLCGKILKTNDPAILCWIKGLLLLFHDIFHRFPYLVLPFTLFELNLWLLFLIMIYERGS
ncbi:hypothetical protein FTV88_0319 [Heliorestis convoluta]|uniref:Uncharacterized protein n=1 Tax=Heliorestis convoluta TaxID=356322 RepID=A0A5Q2MW44_9FIRM|nr:hypothetical protein FTV88_0319 [Heliorestis convoluta]